MKLLPNKPQKECGTTKRWAQKCFNTATRTGWTIDHQSTQQHRSAIIFSNLLQCQQCFVKFITRCMISCGFWKPLQSEIYKFSLFRGMGELENFVACRKKLNQAVVFRINLPVLCKQKWTTVPTIIPKAISIPMLVLQPTLTQLQNMLRAPKNTKSESESCFKLIRCKTH